MKTTIQNTSNDLRHSVTKEAGDVIYKIKIRLNDECKNGHQDFSITGTMYKKGKPQTDRYMIGGGAIGDKIAEKFPEFKIFNDLHLCDFDGVPMHAIENGFYHMKSGFNNQSEDHKEKFCSYYRVTPYQYDILKKSGDKNHFGFLLVKLGVLAQWKKEADIAIKQLEELTGVKFVNDSVKSQFNMNEETKKAIEEAVKNGFYDVENVEKRENQKEADKKAKVLADLKADRDQAIEKARTEYNVKMFVLNHGLPIDNFIYYNHTNEGSFNWKDYDKKITEDQFRQFCDKANFNSLPQGIKFSLKDLKIQYSPVES